MPPATDAQTPPPSAPATQMIVGVDVGGTFTDLVASDGQSLRVVKLPSTSPDFHRAVIDAVGRITASGPDCRVVHGSTVATNALLQRRGEPVAFITTDGFRDMLLIGRQNRPKLYALRVERPAPIVPPENCFVLHERIDAVGQIVEPLDDAELQRIVAEIARSGLRHAAVCLLFSFINPDHERRVGRALETAGITVSLSSDVLPEFREFERASTTAVNAYLRPTVRAYLESLEQGLSSQPENPARSDERPSGSLNEALSPKPGRSPERSEERSPGSVDQAPKPGRSPAPSDERPSGSVDEAPKPGRSPERSEERSPGSVDQAPKPGRSPAPSDERPSGSADQAPKPGRSPERSEERSPGSADQDPKPGRSPERSPGSGVVNNLRIMHSGGGTLSVTEAQATAARLVLSGPAGGVLGAAFVAKSAGFADVITYDMGGTSTDVATVLDGSPQWTTSSVIDGLPVALPMFDIHTVGAGGGSVAYLDAGGALRVGPRSAGALPGPACYARGGTEPTVTDANLVLGRILPDQFLGGEMRVDVELARGAIAPLASAMGKPPIEAALGIIRVAEANMEHAIRAVTSRRGHDPRRFTLVSFGGAGGLHACALAESLDIPRVLVPPYCGVLSALGMVVAPPVTDASKTVAHLGDQLDDARLAAEYGQVNIQTLNVIPYAHTAAVEAWADVRFRGQSHELQIRVERPSIEAIAERFTAAYEKLYGQTPPGRPVEIVTLRIRRIGRSPALTLPALKPDPAPSSRSVALIPADGTSTPARAISRASLLAAGPTAGPLLLLDAEATAYIPPAWRATAQPDGGVVVTR